MTETPPVKHPAVLFVAALLLALVSGVACTTEPAPRPAPVADHAWAAAVEVEALPNLHRVHARLWRGAQPDKAGFVELEKMGVKTVISLRAFHSDADEVGAAGLAGKLMLKRISFKTWHPEKEDIEAFLDIVTDPANGTIFVHCQHGSDRTGTMCAIYRIVIDGWDRESAIAEMVHGGFGFHSVWQNLIDFIRKDISDADIARWRARVAEKRR